MLGKMAQIKAMKDGRVNFPHSVSAEPVPIVNALPCIRISLSETNEVQSMKTYCVEEVAFNPTIRVLESANLRHTVSW